MPSALLSRALHALVFVTLLVLPVPAAVAAGYKITAPLKGVCRPDKPPCTPFNLVGTPSISGDYVVFTSGFNATDAVWSYRISEKKLKKLAGFETKVPGGAGLYTAFGSTGSDFPTAVAGDRVAFHGWDAKGNGGIYTVSVTGGKITPIVSFKSTAPGTGERFMLLRGAAMGDRTVAFWGRTLVGVKGIYRADAFGGELAMVASSEEPLTARMPQEYWDEYYDLFDKPTVGKTGIQFFAIGSLETSVGPNAIFRVRNGVTIIADNLTSLEGGGESAHVRLVQMSAASTTGGVAFEALQSSAGIVGLFKMKTADEAIAFVTTNSLVPGTPYSFNEFRGISYDESGLVFAGVYKKPDFTANWSLYFIERPGEEPVRVASGDKYVMPDVGDRSISKGVIVFVENTNTNQTFYIATPKK